MIKLIIFKKNFSKTLRFSILLAEQRACGEALIETD